MSNNLTPVLISGVSCYEQDGTAYLKLDDVARGLGFTKTDVKVSETGFRKEYVRIDWPRVSKYLAELGIPTSGDDFPSLLGKDSYIPENIFYRLAMKAKNETAEKFQALVADEIIPSIRKHGAYMTHETLQAAILNPDTMIQLCQQLKAEQDKNAALQVANSKLTVERQIMAPKAEYFDELVDRNTLTSFRDTAKELGVSPKAFVDWLRAKKFIYRDKKGKLVPYAEKNDGLFEVRECFNEKTKWSGVQTLVTPKGRETFRLLYL